MKTLIQAAVVTLLAASAAQAQEAVQWKVSDGGNGHWYQLVSEPASLDWQAARQYAKAMGGDLAVLSRSGSTEFVQSMLNGAMCGGSTGQAGPYVGGFQDLAAPDYSEPSDGWRWVDGSLFPGSASISLDDNLGHQDFLHFISLQPSCSGPFVLDDVGLVSNANRSFVVEWSADCNNDGIVDYGQILQGQLVDADANGVPDVCEVDPCPGDITNGGTVDAADLSILLAAWGTNGQAEFDTDIDGSGLVDGGDLALVLGGWGPCPQ